MKQIGGPATKRRASLGPWASLVEHPVGSEGVLLGSSGCSVADVCKTTESKYAKVSGWGYSWVGGLRLRGHNHQFPHFMGVNFEGF